MQIAYELREYKVDLSDLSAPTVARKIGLPAEQVFKTLVVSDAGRNIFMAVIPGNGELDLKALAGVIGTRKLDLAPLKDLQALTGYVRGGVTALAGKKDYPVVADESILRFEVIAVSAGVRGTQMLLAPRDYIRVTKATIGAITKLTR